MEHRQPFGRRKLQAAELPLGANAHSNLAPDRTSGASTAPPSVKDEIEAWKAQRTSFTNFPWRQLSLMAGLCFGLASFVLPKAVNDAVAWPLYLVTGLGFWAGLRKRKPG